MDINELSNEIIDAAIEVHKALGQDFWNLLMSKAYVMS
jgi:hypothetical protein